MGISYAEAVGIARELRASGALPGVSPASVRDKNRARMRIMRHGADVRMLREWPQLAGLHGYDREAQRKRIVRTEARMFRAARQRWPQLAHLKGAEYKAAWKRASRLQTRKIAEAAYRRWVVNGS